MAGIQKGRDMSLGFRKVRDMSLRLACPCPQLPLNENPGVAGPGSLGGLQGRVLPASPSFWGPRLPWLMAELLQSPPPCHMAGHLPSVSLFL